LERHAPRKASMPAFGRQVFVGWERDRSKNTYDRDHDHQFDQGKTSTYRFQNGRSASVVSA
jgi:hypothetical protein